MSMLRRLEALEAKLLTKKRDSGYKLILLDEGETCDKAIERSGLTDWPPDRIILISFVKAEQKLP